MNRTGNSSDRNEAEVGRRSERRPVRSDPLPRRRRTKPTTLFRNVRALVLDVDGVLTDGSEYWGRWGERLKRFNTLDGKGIARLRTAGIKVFVISGEHSPISRRYARSQGLDGAAIGVEDKCKPLRRFAREHRLPLAAIAYVGDDDIDLPCMAMVGVPVAVPNAVREVRLAARYVTRQRGGRGAVREVADLILASRSGRERAGMAKARVRPACF